MPELPEIETIRRSLQTVVGRCIARVVCSEKIPLRCTDVATVHRIFTGARITALQRRGKYLRIATDRAVDCVVHLGMSGRIYLERDGNSTPPKHTHMEWILSDDDRLRYVDPRRFGNISLTRTLDGHDNPLLAHLGPEFDDAALTSAAFIARCRHHAKLSLKVLLLDQRIVPGLGNIYVCEALYHARLDPRRTVSTTSDAELATLLTALRHTLQLGIEKRGTSLRDYVDGNGRPGAMQHALQVYGRESLGTRGDGLPIERFTQHGRSTWWCPIVQK